MKKAAGILFVSLAGNALFLKRGLEPGHGHPGEWDFPGGHLKEGESWEQGALRETREEIGFVPEGERVFHIRTRGSASEQSGVAGNGAPPVIPVPAGAPAPAAIPPVPPVDDRTADYVTFLQRVTNEFTPELDGKEHVGWAWSPLTAPPEPLIPGCRVALDRIGWHETDMARAIADGRISSPQRFENVSLFAIRITGTGVAYRNSIDEYVYRGPENYLNDDFLARCNGLPVIYMRRTGTKKDGFHPKDALLNPDEFAERIVGTIVLPYIAGDEVWGIARIYDDAAAFDMEEKQLSTSPAVFFRNVSVNAKLKLENGSTLLIEGDPSLLDHVCICEQGVWDKGGPPTGVRSESRGDAVMAEADKKPDATEADKKPDAAARKDEPAEREEMAERIKAKEKEGRGDSESSNKDLKAIADALGDLGKRMDAFDQRETERQAKKDAKRARKDATRRRDDDPEEAERLAADKAKKDAAEVEKEHNEKEKAVADAVAGVRQTAEQVLETRRRLDEVAAMIPKAIGDADYHALVDAQARADAVYLELGGRAPRPLAGETPAIYERRCVRDLRQHSARWKGLTDDAMKSAFADDALFGEVRDQVYADALAHARSPHTVAPGLLREVVKRGDGHTVREFHGSPSAWMNQFAGATKLKAEGDWKGLPGRPH